jgi:hypothetical protein
MIVARAVAYGLGAGAVMGITHHHLPAWLVAGAALGGALGLAGWLARSNGLLPARTVIRTR